MLIKDLLLRLNLSTGNCHGQGCDGAATMSGHFRGVQARMKEENSCMVYSHCWMHLSSLGIRDDLKTMPQMRSALDMIREFINFIRSSTKRLANLKSICGVSSSASSQSTIHPLCPTRMAMNAKSLSSFLSGLDEVHELLEKLSAEYSTATSVEGYSKTLVKFNFMFSIKLL